MADQWIPIFRTGEHTDSEGNTKTWTEQDLDHIVDSYDPQYHEAPEVIGHPSTNAPAWGWVEALKRVGDTLFYKPKDRIAEFTDMLKKRMFKKRSISLYANGTLRHVGWLGATPPAVKGLADVAFNDNGATIEFEEKGDTTEDSPASAGDEDKKKEVAPQKPADMQEGFDARTKYGKEKNMLDAIKDLLKKAGLKVDDDTKPRTFSEDEVKRLVTAAADETRKAADKQAADFAEERKKKEDEFKTREDKLKAEEERVRKGKISAFCEQLKQKGVLTPAMEKLGMGLQSFLEKISSIETAVEFGEGEQKKKQTPLEFMQEFLSGLPKSIEFKEVSGGDNGAVGSGSQAGEKLEHITREKMKANKDLTFNQAFSEAQSENPDLAVAYAEDLR
jgi:hypothetical protein